MINMSRCLVNFALCALFVLVPVNVDGLKKCGDPWTGNYAECRNDQYCCGTDDIPMCCDSSWDRSDGFAEFVAFLILALLIFCPIYCCYRCCCRRTAQRGFVYTSANTTPVTVALPPQHNQAPYPSVVPYPQQTPYPPAPYPPQQPVNPYYGSPPPPYGMAQDSFQNASAPTI